MLVFGRIMQGLSGGSLMPLSQTLLLRVFPKERAPAAMALWAMTTLVAPVLGPILGGSICDNLAWPFIFFINVPIALGCAPVIRRLLQPLRDREGQGADRHGRPGAADRLCRRAADHAGHRQGP